ncbi:hypothetical protein BGZ65_006824 [Modicella reniformis]|uniref:ABC transmembrane type-1 domain-containing protein n=1 Tax=Modicella reniformis TaxID=1440133 RepID=A0A9P6IWH2_9FUNG|nr:hypothetical protein BGZ65_006824 [Modicella reniformis]
MSLDHIINRFSKNMVAFDTLLNEIYRMYTATSAMVLSTCILISVIFPYFLIPLVPMLVFTTFLLPTTDRRRLVNITFSFILVCTFLRETQWTSYHSCYREQNRFMHFIDLKNRLYFLSYSIQSWLGVRLENIANTLVFCTSLLGVCGQSEINPATIGLVLSYTMSVTGTFNWAVRQYAEVSSKLRHPLLFQITDQTIRGQPLAPPKIRNLKIRFRLELPLDPVLFSGTIRSNLDAFGKPPDQEFWEVLGRSDLKNYVPSCEGGLE